MQPNDNSYVPNEQPVAYGVDGQPLYTHPAQTALPTGSSTPLDAANQPQVVYLTRAIDPHQQIVSPEVQQKHNESVAKYPGLNLSEGEYVISAVKRHPIGLISIWAVVVLAIITILALPVVIMSAVSLPFTLSNEIIFDGAIVVIMLIILLIFGGIVGTFVYNGNRFFLTNESVTQYIQSSLFSRKTQTISLGNVEDASFRQTGIVQTMMNYGSIRLSTEGEETTYRFNFVANPSEQIRLLNDAIEAFKNFRPINEKTHTI